MSGIESVLVQQKLTLLSFVAGLGVGSGGFVLLAVFRLVGEPPHPETAQVWVFLWISVTFVLALDALNLDIFVGGLLDVFYLALVALGTGLSYLLGGRVLGRPWESRGLK